MTTRYRAGRRSNNPPTPNQAQQHPQGRGRYRIVIVETTTNNEVQLCTVCTHRINELQHDDAAFALKSEYEDLKDENMQEEYNDEEVVDVNAVDDGANETVESTTITTTVKKDRPQTRGPNKPRAKRRFGYDELIKNPLQPQSNTIGGGGGGEMKYQPKRVIFPESEYDILEKKLIDLESKLANSGKDDEFKKLCKIGVLCEERWAELYCRDYNKPLEEYRNEAISVLKHNLDIRRGEGVRPKSTVVLNGGEPVRQSRRDPMLMNPSVSIASGQLMPNPNAPPPRDFYRGSSKRTFGTCMAIRTLTTGPLHNYSYIAEDACFMLENILFDVESRLKRCEAGSKEYEDLVEEGRKLREEWRQAREDMIQGKPTHNQYDYDTGRDITKQPGYDITKCVVLSRARRQRANDEFVDIE